MITTESRHRLHVASTVLATLMAASAGCSSQTATAPASTTPGAAARTRPLAEQATASTQGGDSGGDCALASIYFPFDSSELDRAARDSVADSATCLSHKPSARLDVVGMADSQGTEEYNLALGSRRAQSVTHYLGSLGVQQARLDTQSVGEEFATGVDESGWARDRRAELRVR